jgi:four helix bundle protein
LDEVSEQRGRRVAEVSEQLDRASLLSLLNTAEGNGKRQRLVRAKFFDDARGSATESAACLDALVAKQACTAERVQPGKEILLRIVSILTKLVAKFEADSGDVGLLREDTPDCGAEKSSLILRPSSSKLVSRENSKDERRSGATA